MNAARWLMVVALGMLSCTWARADGLIPGHYDLIPEGWDPGQTFNFIPFSDPNPNAADAFGSQGLNTSDFQNSLCTTDQFCSDPGFKFNGNNNSVPQNGTFDFSVGAVDTNNNNQVLFNDIPVPNGGFENTGAPINEVLIFLTSNSGQPNPDQANAVFTCDVYNPVTDPTGIFQNCGYFNDGLVLAYWGPVGGNPIPSIVPEPSEWAILPLAFAAVIVARIRKGSASSTFSQTPR
jgi:hypothetical protein